MTDGRDDAGSMTLAGRVGAVGEPLLEPFFRLEQPVLRSPLRRVVRLWPVLVLLVVLLFFAVAGLQR